MVPSARRQVFVVEDDSDIRESLVWLLEAEGYDVVGAANGLEAMERLRSAAAPPGVILLDLMMPVMNGWQFRSEQLRDPHFASIPVVVISADGSIQRKASAIDAVGYLRKPIEIDELLGYVDRFCEGTADA